MIEAILGWSIRNRGFVAVLAILLGVAGVWAVRETPVDAIPDLSDVQVIVYAEYPGQAPEVVEDQVAYPLSTALLAVPHARDVRSTSAFGYSLSYVIFEDGTDPYDARSRVLEVLDTVTDRLPPGASTRLGPDATGVGWVYMYALTDSTPRAEALRATLDRDGDHRVSDAELPSPTGRSVARGEPIAVYTTAELQDLLPDASSEDREHLTWAFDRDADGALSQVELGRAANFRGVDLAELRSIQDWRLRYDLTPLAGVSEVASVGGFVREVHVEVDPERLRAFGVSLAQVTRAIRDSNMDVGGGVIEIAETEFMVRGRGYLGELDDLRTVPVAVDHASHTPVLLAQLAQIQEGPASRRGIAELDGNGEVVGGIVVMRQGENALDVINAVEAKLAQVRPTLPEGVEIRTTYDRSTLIERAVSSLIWKLLEEMLVVAAITLLFLLHVRSAAVALITLPLGVLGALLGMRVLGVDANLMSLGGIAIALGVMVDAAVVMVENVHKHRERNPHQDQLEVVLAAAREVGPALFYSLAIVTVSFLPVFALTGQEGKLFTPLAWTKTLSIGAATILSITLLPALVFWFVRGRLLAEANHPISRILTWGYRPLVRWALAGWPVTLLAALALVGVSIWPMTRLGTEFMPPLNELDLMYMPTTPPGLSVSKAREVLQQTDRLIAGHPQVEQVFGKIGRAETATDPAPLTMIETTIRLTPQHTWPAGKTRADVVRELDARVRVPGLTNSWTQPIRTRIDMLATGIRTPVGIKLLGDDLAELQSAGRDIEAVLRDLDGTASVYSDRVVGGRYLDIAIRRDDAARYGVNVSDLQGVVASAIGGMPVTTMIDGLERVPVKVRYPRELRDDVDSLQRVAVPTPMGHTVPLSQVADIGLRSGPPMIKSEDARRTAWIQVALNTDNVGGYVERAKRAVETGVDLPEGVSVLWSGQYESIARAWSRMTVIVPVTVVLILLLLFLHFRRVGETLIVVATLPFALIGAIWLVWALDYQVSVAVVVGFIALAGLAAETGVVMIIYLDEAVARYRAEGRLRGPADLVDAVMEGAVGRLRPKLMTVLTTLLGLTPVLWGTEPGTQVLRRIAMPMVGGLVTSALLTLLVLPAAYLVWRKICVRLGWEAWQD